MTSKTIQFAARKFLPVMLSPMAGVTTAPLRTLCRSFAIRALNDAPEIGIEVDGLNTEPGIFVDEMVAARPFAQSNNAMQKHLQFAPQETFRSMQLYCLDAHFAYLAAKRAASSKRVEHIDLNFGCPVKKVTSSGGGSAIPWKNGLYTDIIQAVQKGAKEGAEILGAPKVPVSVKIRIGLDDEHVTYLDAGKIAAEQGVEAVTLHARTNRDYYSGQAKWEYIAALREALPSEVLVFGNGDIWSVADAKQMLEQTKADGVAVGRGATGKPWLFFELAKYFATGEVVGYNPSLEQVVETALEHLRMQIDFFSLVSRPNTTFEETTKFAINDFRTALGLYLKGFRVGAELRQKLMLANTYADVEHLLYTLDLNQSYPEAVEGKPRGRTRSTKKIYLPHGWLDSRM